MFFSCLDVCKSNISDWKATKNHVRYIPYHAPCHVNKGAAFADMFTHFNVILSFFTDCLYIGLIKMPSGSFEWIQTEQPMSYDNFYGTEPNAEVGREECVIMFLLYGDKWADYGCTGPHLMLCEF